MPYIKQVFSIKDLENLSGIKAHTIRIWEKRYNVLQPNRTNTNLRMYDVEALQKILNVAYLNENGHKISKISTLSPTEITTLVKKTAVTSKVDSHALQALKLAMIDFDQQLFQSTYTKLASQLNFREIFQEIFIPFLREIGFLWQTNTITPSHEHFISNLIRQKIYSATEAVQYKKPKNKEKAFVLFLPEGEIHDLGLLYVNYELLLTGYQTIVLGHSIPLKELNFLKKNYTHLYFLSYMTVKPDNLTQYIGEFNEKVSQQVSCEYWLMGPKVKEIHSAKLPANIRYFSTIQHFINIL